MELASPTLSELSLLMMGAGLGLYLQNAMLLIVQIKEGEDQWQEEVDRVDGMKPVVPGLKERNPKPHAVGWIFSSSNTQACPQGRLFSLVSVFCHARLAQTPSQAFLAFSLFDELREGKGYTQRLLHADTNLADPKASAWFMKSLRRDVTTA
eukprot:1154731-Pelagomonas_calceolata.AAC.11